MQDARRDRGKQQARRGSLVMAASERHFVAAMIILRFLQDDHRFGCGHDGKRKP